VLVAKVMERKRREGLLCNDGAGGGVAVGEDIDKEVLREMIERAIDGVAGLIENHPVVRPDPVEEGDNQNPFLIQLRGVLSDAFLHHPGAAQNPSNSSPEDIDLQSSLGDFLSQMSTVALSILHDPTLANFLTASTSLLSLLPEQKVLQRLVGYGHVLIPKLLSRLPCIPIPRLEILSPASDLLMENLIVTPIPDGSSLLPSTVKIKTNTNINLTDRNSSPTTATATTTAVYINNLTPLTAQKVGYILRLHPTRFLPTITSRGLISLTLPKGISLVITHNPHPAKTSPKIRVRVKIPGLAYTVVDSTGCGGVMTLLRPILSPIVCALTEARIAEALTQTVGDLEKEVDLARERVRGAKAAGLTAWGDVVKAVCAGLGESFFSGDGAAGNSEGEMENDASDDDDNVEISLGISAARRNSKSKLKGAGSERKGWEGVYAPGSVVGLWEEEERRERERDSQMHIQWGRWPREGWRSGVFDWYGPQ